MSQKKWWLRSIFKESINDAKEYAASIIPGFACPYCREVESVRFGRHFGREYSSEGQPREANRDAQRMSVSLSTGVIISAFCENCSRTVSVNTISNHMRNTALVVVTRARLDTEKHERNVANEYEWVPYFEFIDIQKKKVIGLASALQSCQESINYQNPWLWHVGCGNYSKDIRVSGIKTRIYIPKPGTDKPIRSNWNMLCFVDKGNRRVKII